MEEGGKLAQLLIDGKIKEIRTPNSIYRTGDNIMPLVIEAASATQFSLDHGRTVRRGMDGSFRSGGCPQMAPQGYRNSRDPLNLKKGAVIIDATRYELVRRGWQLLLTGTQTVKQVTDTMNQSWGYKARPTRKRASRPLSYSGAYQIFTNPFYAGFIRRKGELVKGRHQAMISFAEFERAQAILHRRSFSFKRHHEHDFTGLMHCVFCGQQITGEVKRLRDGSLWENYHCSDSKLSCTKLGLSRSKVFERIAKELDSLEVDPNALTIARENILRSLESECKGSGMILEAQQSALEATYERIKRLDDMWLDGIVTDRARFRELEERELLRKAEIVKEIERIRTESERITLNLKRSEEFLSRAREEFHDTKDWRVKEIARALATDYQFDGRQKKIDIEVHPILSHMVSYVRKIERLEPTNAGSQSMKKPTSEKLVFSGGRERCELEPDATLLNALKAELFPDMWQKSGLRSLKDPPQLVTLQSGR